MTAETECGCDCVKYNGGCVVHKPGTQGYACKCKYWGQWCLESDEECDWHSSYKCLFPDQSYEYCLLGGGDCSGYLGGRGSQG